MSDIAATESLRPYEKCSSIFVVSLVFFLTRGGFGLKIAPRLKIQILPGWSIDQFYRLGK